MTLRYIDRATGHIDDYSLDTGTSTEITNTTVPEVYQGFFSGDGSRVFVQTIDTNNQINTVSASIPTTTAYADTGLLDIRFLPKNIVTLKPNGQSLFYLVSVSDGSIGYVSDLDGTKPSQVFSSGLSELLANWAGGNVTLLTKPSYSAEGYLFHLNTKTGLLTPILDNVTGLTALENQTGTYVFNSASGNGTVESSVYDEKKNSSRSVPLSALADKCVWSAKDTSLVYCAVPTNAAGNLPDDWYQGNIFLAGDNVWAINADSGVTNVVDFLSETNPNIDPENLALDSSERWLAFIDKEDLTLWALRIAQ